MVVPSATTDKKQGDAMSIRARKMLVDFDYSTSHGRLTFERDELIDVASLVETPPPPQYLQEAVEVPIPLFDINNTLTAIREVGPDGTYYLWLRTGFYLAKIVVDPDDVFVDVTYNDEQLIYCFHNGTKRNCISITAIISEDVGGTVANKLMEHVQDGIWRQYIVRDALLKPNLQKLRDPSSPGPSVMTAIEVGRYLRVEEKTVRNWTSEGKIPYVKMGGLTRYRRDDIDSAFSSALIGNTSRWKKRRVAKSKGREE
jgi:excisionase family DNA binding protein